MHTSYIIQMLEVRDEKKRELERALRERAREHALLAIIFNSSRGSKRVSEQMTTAGWDGSACFTLSASAAGVAAGVAAGWYRIAGGYAL
jgi:hypothetical protein